MIPTKIILSLILISSVSAALIQITPQNNLIGNSYLSKTEPNINAPPSIPYNFRWNGTATYDTVNQNATAFIDINDANNNVRVRGLPIQINVTSDNFQTIYDRIQGLMWNQYLLDAGSNQNALLYFFKATYYYDVGVCWAR